MSDQPHVAVAGVDGGGLDDAGVSLMIVHRPVLTSIERAMLRTGKPREQIEAERDARFDAITTELAARDAAEFSDAVQRGIVPPTDPRIQMRSCRGRPAHRTNAADTLPSSSSHRQSARDKGRQSYPTGLRARCRAVLVRAASFVLRDWRSNPTVAGRGEVASLSPEGRTR